MAVYSLTTYINDTPNPIEMLRANVAWTTADAEICLSAQALQDFALGRPLKTGESCYGCRGAFWVHKTVGLAPGETYTFSIVMDCGYDHARLAKCRQYVAQGDFGGLRQDIEKGRARLREIVRQADGVQESADPIACAHHYLNTLYNVMRGGTFENGYAFDLEDFARFARIRNRPFCGRQAFWERIKECETIQQAREKAAGDRDAMRLMMEYLPLSFSRRHGDPSRPWNRFSIRLKDEDGKKISRYEGNWRDIFQNWEALGLSFPGYYENMVAKFVNASTVDGFNPYRITSEGIDWERPQPDNPFSGIGYWGDHQIIYLLRLLNGLKAHFPDRLDEMLGLEIFSYADVPYRIKPFEQIVENSKDTIVYCADLDRQIEERCARMGTDGRLVLKDGAVYTVTLAEKLMVPMLAKVCNLMKNGGIWMNTQRPEWNDANNAIVGIGLSMVTVYHLYAYLDFVQALFEKHTGSVPVSVEVARWMRETARILRDSAGQAEPFELLRQLGEAFSAYRTQVYEGGMSGKTEVCFSELKQIAESCRAYAESTIQANGGDLYATYNLLKKDFSVEPMRPMLEGQAAAIGARILPGPQVERLLDNMDALYIPAARAHALYPVKTTTPFVQRNVLGEDIPEVPGVTVRDETGALHFAADIVSDGALQEALAKAECGPALCRTLRREFERVFRHGSFTGRSQVMYRFEGIGCVYWHQNAKLALAVLESVAKTRQEGKDARGLYQKYRALTSGFICHKSSEECGAIPIEPYSHTSYNGNSEQPGMTGQVKESVLMRRMELGFFVEQGTIRFDPWFLSRAELGTGGVALTICGCPIRLLAGDDCSLEAEWSDGWTTQQNGLCFPCEWSREIFARSGKVRQVRVNFKPCL